MNLNINGKLPRFYRWSYGVYILPKNFCNYCWKLLFALVLAPLTWISFPMDGAIDNLRQRLFVSALMWGAFVLTAFGIFKAVMFPYEALFAVVVFIGGVVAFLLLLALAFGCGYVWERVTDDEEKGFAVELLHTIKVKKDAVKENHCPKIDWVESDNDS